ncbi:MAG: poly-beta-1,6 N-acetyl-D-glucosamine synthase, partial [Enterobacterales bacterium]|nr:poly-beta-1,6 N-acetyl-D-glucosamine synthase [Enterobacterales bacterium]
MNHILSTDIPTLLFGFVFYYPFFMAWLWMLGGLIYFVAYERHDDFTHPDFTQAETPRISIIVPCYNEEPNVREVIAHLQNLNYPNYEVLAVNDGSHDRTGEILNELVEQYPSLMAIHQDKNQGKAVGLNTAAQLATGDFILCMDGDALLDPNALHFLVSHFIDNPHMAAVTGNPRIRNRTSLLGRMQVGEFSSTVGLIKRCQQGFGRLFTVSGVIALFRKSALEEVGYWSVDMLTEDIDISWMLQTHGWEIRYEPRALTWILTPETLVGLYRQRLRWSKGGVQTVFKYFPAMFTPRNRMMLPLFCEYVVSIFWAYCMAFAFVLMFADFFFQLPIKWQISVVPVWNGMVLGGTCLLQRLV